MSRSPLPRIDTARVASITVVTGSSGSGKSAWLKNEISQAPRVLVWDVDGEYCELRGFRTIHKAGDLLKILRAAPAGRFAFVPRSTDLFELWSLAAFAWGTCVVIAEETADVTSPGKAPAGWGQLVRRGRKRGIQLFAVTQRPSESDKTVIGNASRFHVCKMNRANDRAYMARELDVDQARIDALLPLEFLEKNCATGELTPGKLVF